jgi:hypothetical protein
MPRRPDPPSGAASDGVKLTNLTPLDLWVENESLARFPLRPFDEVKARRPPDSKFGVIVNGAHLGHLLVDPQPDSRILPGSFSKLDRPCTARRRPPAPRRARSS